MSVTSNLKKVVDIPVWEWLRPLPIATNTSSSAPNTFATAGKPYARYIYHLAGATNGIFRYDTWSDSWSQVTSAPYSQATVAATRYNDSHGYHGRVISSPSLSSLQVGIPRGKKAVGLKIKIINGTGAGQERTITDVADSVVEDVMVQSATGSTVQITDSNKNYTRNQYRDYVIRIIGNSNTDIRKILWNSNNTVVFADFRFTSYGNRWAYSTLPFTPSSSAGSQTIAQIESSVITVDIPFTVQPDATSEYIIEGGGLWNINLQTSTRFAFQYYDIFGDAWYVKSSNNGGLLNAALGTDVAIETLNERAVGILLTETALSGTSSTIQLTGNILTTDQYANYIIRLTEGTGAGQERAIYSNSLSAITINRSWDTIPDNTTKFSIVADYEKIYMTGGAGSTMFEYDCINDVWADKRIIESSTPSNMCAVFTGYKKPIAISTITRSGTTATVTTVNPHGLKNNETVTIFGASDALYNIAAPVTVTGDSTFTYTMAGTPGANAAAAASQSATLLVDPSKNWPVNSLVGRIVTFTTTAYTQTAGFAQALIHRVITANTATTITFDSTTAPTAGTTAYYITDLRNHGAIVTDRVSTGSSTTVINLVTGGLAVNRFGGRRCVIVDGANWAEASISSNTATAITVNAALGFTPSSSAIISILENSPTGAGCSLEYLYNTSTNQRGRYMFGTRGGATNHFLLYDITSNTWQIMGQIPNAETFTAGTMTAYDGEDRVYIHRDATGRIYYYDFTDNNLYNAGTVPYGMGTATLGNRMAITKTEDNLKYIFLPRHSGQEFWRLLLWT